MSIEFSSVLLSFIPLFVAIDVFGVIPIFLSLTERLEKGRKDKLVTEATITALAVAVVFLFGGRAIFRFLGITENDFRVGGGIVLLVIAVIDLISSNDKQRNPGDSVGVVPIGIPLIIGPAALTTILILVDTYGYWMTILSILLNLFIVWLVFRYSRLIGKVMGKNVSNAVAKVAALFMVAIAVMMIRVGLGGMIAR
ncbi:MAG TPA: MarC family protein [Bacteroidota bacterium]